MHGRQAALAVMLAGLAACGGDDGVTVARERFNVELARALCMRQARCGVLDDVARCQAQQLSTGFVKQFGLSSRHEAALDAGRMRYDPEVAGQCLVSIAAGDCDDAPLTIPMMRRGIEYDTPCQFLQGQLRDGDTCEWSTECAGGAYCDATPSSCGGVCRRGPAPEPVTGYDACAPGTLLIEDRCLTPSPRGGPCGYEAGGRLTGVCGEGLWCDPERRTCRPVSTEGGACDDFAGPLCGWSLFCRDGRCQKPMAEGGPCTAPGTGRFGTLECKEELFCDGEQGQPGTCRPRREEGAACRNFFECGDGMNCFGARPGEGVWGTCQRGLLQGESCGERPCDIAFICSSTTRTCQPLVRLGERCDDPDSCFPAGVCVGGVCRPHGAESCG